jgi:hypothetical protein
MTVNTVYAGAAPETQLNGSMSPSSPAAGQTFAVDSTTGYPSDGEFVITVDGEAAGAEKIKVTTASGTSFEVVQRGYDDTVAQSHDDNAPVNHVVDAASLTAFAEHVDDVEADPHATKLLNNTRHDTTARHVLGTAIPVSTATPATITPDSSGSAGNSSAVARANHDHPIATAAATTVNGTNAEGTSGSFARADHNHALGANVVGTSQLVAASVVKSKLGADLSFTTGFLSETTNSATVDNNGSYLQIGSRTFEMPVAGIAVIVPSVSLRTQSNLAVDFDWRMRVQVDNSDHPVLATLNLIDGWIEVTHNEGSQSVWVCEPIFWPCTAGAHTARLDILNASGSGGDMLRIDPKLKVYPLGFT